MRSGLFLKLVDKARPILLESVEWKLQLSKDLNLEYTSKVDKYSVVTGNILR